MFHYLKVFIRFRFLQAGREFKATGWFISSLILACVFLVFIYFSGLLNNTENAHYVLLASFLPLTIAAKRKDHSFLRKFNKNYRWLIAADLALFCLPFILLFLYKMKFIFIVVLLFFILVAAAQPALFTNKVSAGRRIHFISPKNFEWRTGVRQHLYLLLAMYACTLILITFPIVSLAGLWFLHMIFVSFYQYNEPASFISAFGRRGKDILLLKIRKALVLQAVIQVPVLIFYNLFHEGAVLITVLLFLMFQISLVFAIVSKYAFYQPNAQSGPSQFYQLLAVISFVIPFFVPVPLVLSLIWVKKATVNLENYVTGNR